MLENAGKLEFPFRRYQIQKAWRGERPQEGRYREFTQADIDVVGRDDAAVPLRRRGGAGDGRGAAPRCRCRRCRLQVNNRKLIQGFYRGLGIADVDRGDPRSSTSSTRSGRRRWPRCSSSDAGRDRRAGRARASRWPRSESPTPSFVDAGPRARRRATSCSTTGLAELAAVHRRLRRRVRSDRFAVEANLRIARGLDYYTGTVYEIYMVGYERLKSVGSGGRYDALASDGRTTYPGVGISFGVSRTLVPLLSRGRARRQPRRCRPPCWSRWPTRSAGRPATRIAHARCARRGIACEVAAERRRSSASRSATPSGAASRTSGSPARDGARRGQGHPLRRPGRPPTRRPGRPRPPTSDRESSSTTTDQGDRHRDPHP